MIKRKKKKVKMKKKVKKMKKNTQLLRKILNKKKIKLKVEESENSEDVGDFPTMKKKFKKKNLKEDSKTLERKRIFNEDDEETLFIKIKNNNSNKDSTKLISKKSCNDDDSDDSLLKKKNFNKKLSKEEEDDDDEIYFTVKNEKKNKKYKKKNSDNCDVHSEELSESDCSNIYKKAMEKSVKNFKVSEFEDLRVRKIKEKMVIKVISIHKKYSNFNIGQTFTIRNNGLEGNINNSQINLVNFGRNTQNTINDIVFHEKDIFVSRSQLSIDYLNQEFYLSCTSSKNPTCLLIEDISFKLWEDIVFSVNLDEVFYVKKIASKENFSSPLKTNRGNEKCFSFDIDKEESSISILAKEKREKLGEVDLPCDKNTEKITEEYIEIVGMYGILEDESKKLPQIIDKVYTIGSDENSDIFIDDKKNVNRFHLQIKYTHNKTWVIAEKMINEQEKFSDNGSYLFIKNFDQFEKRTCSNKLKIEKGMKIQAESTRFEVISLE